MMDNNQAPVTTGYGYADDSATASNLTFGGNFGNTFLTKFEYTLNGGKGGGAMEAVDIEFTIGGTPKSYRRFPITSAKDYSTKPATDITDPRHPKFIEEQKALSAVITQILKCFRTEADITAGFARPIANFREFIEITRSMLPPNFFEVKLDIFLQWQSKISNENDRTYLEIPQKINQGKFVVASVPPQGGEWIEDRTATHLRYKDAAGNAHPFERGKWWMESSGCATQQTENTGAPAAWGATTGAATAAPAWGAPPVAGQPAAPAWGGQPQPSAWGGQPMPAAPMPQQPAPQPFAPQPMQPAQPAMQSAPVQQPIPQQPPVAQQQQPVPQPAQPMQQQQAVPQQPAQTAPAQPVQQQPQQAMAGQPVQQAPTQPMQAAPVQQQPQVDANGQPTQLPTQQQTQW
jgi:hypothetical protein